MKPEFDIRLAFPRDINFIYSTWLESFRQDSHLGKTTSRTIFFERYRTVIDAILSRDHTQTWVAVHPEDPNVIFGYLIYEHPNIFHYCFVKEAFRDLGIAKALTQHLVLQPDLPLTVTHRTQTSRKIQVLEDKFEFDPFLLYQRSGNI